MKARISLLFALMFLVMNIGFTQELIPPVEELVDEFNFFQKRKVKQSLRKAEKYQKQNKDSFDFFLPAPIPLPETAISANPWHTTYLEVINKDKEMIDLAKTAGFAFLLDTGVPENKILLGAQYPGHINKNHTSDPTVIDGNSHSSHISGLYVYRDNNRQIGVFPGLKEANKFYIGWHKVCTNGGGCATNSIISAIDESIAFYNKELKPKGIPAIISLSLGGGSFSASFNAAIERANAAGILVAASSGNNGRNSISYPANYDDAIALGAHDASGKKANFSNWDEKGGLFAVGPGVAIISTGSGENRFVTFNGTSMGNPLFNWVFLFTKMVKPTWSWVDVVDFTALHAFDLNSSGYDNTTGYGTIKLDKFITALKDDDTPDPPTCDDGKRNGNEEGIDCGGNCPPCDTDPCDKRYTTQEVYYTFKEDWSTRWRTVSGTSEYGYDSNMELGSAIPIEITYESIKTNKLNDFKLQSFNRVKIVELSVSIKTEYQSPCAKEELGKVLNDYFSRYALLLSDNSDFTDAGKFSVYFADMMSNRNHKVDITVHNVVIADEDDVTAFWLGKSIPVWPRVSGVPEPYYDTNTQPWIVEVLWEKKTNNGGGAFPVDIDVDRVSSSFRLLLKKGERPPRELSHIEDLDVFKKSSPGIGYKALGINLVFRID